MTTAGVLVLTLALLAAGASLWWGWRMRWERDAARAETADARAALDGLRAALTRARAVALPVPDDGGAGARWSRRR